MKKILIGLGLFIILGCVGKMKLVNESPELLITLPEKIQKLFSPFTVSAEITANYDNPFDVGQIKVDLIMKAENGAEESYPMFYSDGDAQRSHWQGRITPQKTGHFTCFVQAISAGHKQCSESFSVEVQPSNLNGFLRRNPDSHFTFLFDNGKPFRGLGENVCWTHDYEYYFNKLHENGCNFARIWMCPWNFALEWKDSGLQNYNLNSAAGLDSLLELAEKYDLYLMLCFGYHGELQKSEGYFKENRWLENPYNATNGGPCETKEEFFTHPSAKAIYKNRLRYIAARWAYHPRIACWEFWNEVDLTAGRPAEVIAWHDEMSTYLRSIDPYKHLISSSFSGDGYADMWALKNLDISQNHPYNAPDFSQLLPQIIETNSRRFNKPHVIGEFGVDFRGPAETLLNDPNHIGFHNGLWAGLFSPTPILPLTWWWDNVIDPQNLYHQLQAIHAFSAEIFVDTQAVIIKWIDPIIIPASDEPQADYVINPQKPFGRNETALFEIDTHGFIANESEIPAFLYGGEKSAWGKPPVFKINYSNDGFFTAHVNHVSNHGLLKIYLDGQLALEKDLPLGAGAGEWVESKFNEEWGIYQGRYDKQYRVAVPAGQHEIRVENAGADWLEIIMYKFERCGVSKPGVIKTMALQKGDDLYLWIRNGAYFWKNVLYNGMPQAIAGAQLNLNALSPGAYRLEWWDTYSGQIDSTKQITVESSQPLSIDLPPLAKDAACKIKRINE